MLSTTQELLSKWNPEQKRQVLTKAFFGIAENWKLTNDEKAQLLGWRYSKKRSVIDAMKNGKRGIELDADKLQRIIEILNIHKNLRMLFPHNREPAYRWIKEKRERFGNHSALEVMLNEGAIGIIAIRRYLDHVRTA